METSSRKDEMSALEHKITDLKLNTNEEPHDKLTSVMDSVKKKILHYSLTRNKQHIPAREISKLLVSQKIHVHLIASTLKHFDMNCWFQDTNGIVHILLQTKNVVKVKTYGLEYVS